MFGIGLTELLVILAIVLLVFGPKRLKTLGSDLGGAIKGFRNAMDEDERKEQDDPRVIEGRVDEAAQPHQKTESTQDRHV